MVYGLGLGGVERTAQNFAMASHELGYETTVLTFETGPRARNLETAGIRVVMGADLADLPRQDFIGLHSHGLNPAQVDALLDSQPNARVCEKNVFSTPSPWMSRLDVSFQLSPWAHWLYGQRGGDLSRSSTLGNPTDPHAFWHDIQGRRDFRSRHAIPHDSVVLGRVGQPLSMKWSPKVYSVVCDEVRSDHSLQLLLIGAPAEIVSLVRDRLPATRYTLVDKVTSDADLRAAYSAMDLFVHAARQGESFGNVISEAALCEVPTLTIATPWADNSQGHVSGPSSFVAASLNDFRLVMQLAVSDPDDLERRGKLAREYTLTTFASVPMMSEVIEIAKGNAPRREAPEPAELATSRYLGQNPIRFARSLAFGKNSYLLGPLTGQESWRWAATTKLNSWGISRYGISRPQRR